MSNYQDLIEQKRKIEQQAAELERQIEEVRKAQRAQAVADIQKIMVENGLTLDDFEGYLRGLRAGKVARKGPKAGAKVPPKYRNAETGESWTGRGLLPKWLKAALAAGRSLEDFKV